MQYPATLKLTGSILHKVEEMAAQPLEEEQILLEGLEEYLESARRHLPRGSNQLGLAEGISARVLELLKTQEVEPCQRLAQAALKYLLKTDDMISDFESPHGLYDDVEVFNAIAAALGREDLCLSLD